MKRVRGECPLGSKCEVVRVDNGDQVLVTCPWFKKVLGTDAQGNDHDEWDCAIGWMPVLQLEMAGTNRGQTEALCSFRDEVMGHTPRRIEDAN